MKFKRTLLFFLAIVITMTSVNLGTVAWFTDQVSSGKNDIQGGNLDAVLMQNGKELSDTDLLFDEVALWEPGVVAYENLTVKNAGDLAFKYQLYPNVLGCNHVAETGKSLMDVLKFAVVEGTLDETSVREEITKNAEWAGVGSGHAYTCNLLEKNKTQDVTVVIWWEPTGYDNDLNLNNGKTLSEGEALSIDMGVKLDATQAVFEEDSFGADYDEDAFLPKLPMHIRQTVPVTVADGKVAVEATISAGDVQAVIPAGVLVNDGVTSLTLVITSKDKSDANIRLEENEDIAAYDVKIEGVSKNNTVPMAITLGEVAPKYMNIGPLKIYHEGHEMDSYANGAADSFAYDPATGVATIYLATFSEIALVADEENAWEGKFDYGWYDADANELTIANADQLAGFGAIVGGMNSQDADTFEGKTVKLIADVNLGDAEKNNVGGKIFYPIGYYNSTGSYKKTSDGSVTSSVSSFEGTFDGNGHTIANFYQNTWEMFGDYNDGYSGTPNYYKDAMGLFGYVKGGTIKNLTVDNFSSDGEYTTTGVIAAYADGKATFENIAITNCNPRVYNTGNGGIIGIAGDTRSTNDDHITLTNITVDNSNKISALWGSWDVACGGLVGMYRGNVDGSGSATGDTISFENCHVAAQIDVYNDVCANYQYYAYRYSGMIIGSVRHNTTNSEGKTIPNMTGISASGCTVNYGDWNDYYYCEFEKNSIASYSKDYQFSRVPHSELNFTDSNGNGVVDANERASVTGCKHTHTAEENHQAIYLPFHQLFTGYSWGVSSIGLEKYSGIVTDLGITEGDQQESVVKFEAKNPLPELKTGSTLRVGDLFAAVAQNKVAIDIDNVQVTVSPVGDESTVSAIYTPDPTNWTEGTLAFTDIGAAQITISDYYFCVPCSINAVVMPLSELTATFVADGEFIASIPFTEGDTELANTPKVPEKLGYTGKWESYTLGKQNITIEAIYTPIEYTVTFIADDKQEAICTYTVENKGITAPAVPFKPGYEGEWEEYNLTTGNITVYAVYTKIPAEFNTVFKNTDKYTYRVGNANTIKLSSLFKVEDGMLVNGDEVQINSSNSNVRIEYNSNTTDWGNGTIQFRGTGFTDVTISEGNGPKYTLSLEVVDAVNATSATSAKSNNVVLLDDVSLHTIEVSGGYTLYGNGFKMTATSDVMYDTMGVGFVTLKNGTLDNVQIICPNFSYAIVYNNQIQLSENTAKPSDSSSDARGNVRSAVMADGNSKIVNSYVHGGRAAIFLRSGNLVVDRSTISGGATANIHALSAQSLTLRNATLIQKPFQATVHDTGKTIMGFSGLFGCGEDGNSTPLVLEGTLVQDAWADETDEQYVPSAASSVVSNALTKTDYLHDLDGDGKNESLNLGFAYIPQGTGGKTNADVRDNRTNKDEVPYSVADVTAMSTTARVYSYKNSKGTSDGFKNVADYVPTKQGLTAPTVSFADTNADRVFETVFDANDMRWESTLTVNLDNGDYTFRFDKLLVQKYGKNLIYTVKTSDGTVVDTSKGIALTASGVTEYVLTVTDGDATHTVYFILTASKTSIPEPVVADTTGGTPLLVVKSKNSDWSCAIPALEGIKIKYYTSANNADTLDLATLTPTSTGKQNGTNNYWETTKDGYKLKVTCGYIHDTKQVYGMPVVVNNGGNKMYFTISSTNGYVSTNTSGRTVTLTYEFTDPNGKTLTFSKTWQFNYADYKNGTQYSYSDFVGGTLKEASSGGCVTPDTLVTLADGSKKEIQHVTHKDQLLVWNFYKGEYEAVPASIIFNMGEADYQIIDLHFEDGTSIKTINGHRFFDADTNAFVLIDGMNVDSYLGHAFAKVDGDSYKFVKLVDYSVREEYSGCYSIMSAYHYNFMVEDMFSTTFHKEDDPLFSYFAIGDEMKYDAAAMQADIEKYGMYNYEEFADVLTPEQFDALGVKYMRVSVGKGQFTFEGILKLIDQYLA